MMHLKWWYAREQNQLYFVLKSICIILMDMCMIHDPYYEKEKPDMKKFGGKKLPSTSTDKQI